MPTKLNPTWCATTAASIIAVKKGALDKFQVDLTFSLSKQYVIKLLNQYEVPYRVIPLGCGVTRITTETDICPKCGGRGRV